MFSTLAQFDMNVLTAPRKAGLMAALVAALAPVAAVLMLE